MKKIILLLLYFIGYIYNGLGQTQSLDFPITIKGCSINDCVYSDFSQKPKISHGSPKVVSGTVAYRLDADNDTAEMSEGFFLAYGFKCNHKYSFDLIYNGEYIVNFYIVAANGLKENNDDSCVLGKLPDITDKKSIFMAEGYIGNFFHADDTTINNWIPDKNYKYIWFYTTPVSYNNGYATIRAFTIIDHGNWDYEAPTTPQNLHVTNIDANSISVAWQASTDNACLKNYKIYLNSTFYKETTSTSYKIDHLDPCSNYKIEIKAFDYAGNSSESTHIYAATISDKPPIIVLNTEYSDSIRKIVIASEKIYLKSGFHFKADNNNQYFIARIESCGNKTPNFSPTFKDSLSETKNSVTIKRQEQEIKFKELSLNFYPNPFKNKVQISYFLPQESDIAVEIYDIYGQKVKQIEHAHKQAGLSQYRIDLSSLQSGVYFCTLKTQQGIISKKIIKI